MQEECADVEHPRIAAHLDGILGRLRRVAVGSFFALGALALLTVPMLLLENGEYAGQVSTYLKIVVFLGAYVGETCILWMPIGCLAAAIPGVARTLRCREITAK